METRNKNRSTAPSESGASQENLSQDPATRIYELEQIEKAIAEREKRLHAQENMLRQQLDSVETSRVQLDRDRESFNRNMVTREKEIAAKERELERKSSEPDPIPFDEPPLEILHTARGDYTYSPSRPLPSGSGGNGGGGGNEPPAPKVSFREATESVPYFDGYNIPLAQFTRACRRASEIIPPAAERNLTKLLINKLGRRAYYVVEDEPCDTVTELIDLLTGAFGSPKTLDQYRGELSTVYLRSNEHILDYISRVKDLRTAILDEERRDKRRLDPRFVVEIDNLTARSFYEGLPLEFRLQIGPETRRKHTDAFAAAKAIAKRRELDYQRQDMRHRLDRDRDPRYSTPQRSDRVTYRGSDYPRSDNRHSYHSPSYPPRDRPAYRDNDYQWPRPQRETGARIPDPRSAGSYARSYEPRSDNRYQSTYTRSSPQREPPIRTYDDRDRENYREHRESRPTEKTCRYCKGIGHDINECRKRQFNNTRRDEAGNAPGPSGRRDTTPADDQKRTRPLNPIEAEKGHNESEHE